MKNVKGGSQASVQVVKLVSPSTFDKLNMMFTDKATISGGSSCRKAQSINMNETGQKMLVFHKTGGQQQKKTAPKKAVKKGGFALLSGDQAPPANVLPPAVVPSPSHSSLSLAVISPEQQSLASQQISAMNSISKVTVFPKVDAYKGAFALGGAKKKPQPKSKKPIKPKPNTDNKKKTSQKK